MAYKESYISRSVPNLSVRRELLRERLENFPWWFVAILVLAVVAGTVVFTRPSFNEAFQFIVIGLSMTVTTTLAAFAFALLLGLLSGLGRISRSVVVRNVATFYVEIVRGIPMLVLIFFIALVGVPALANLVKDLGILNLQTNEIPMNLRAIVALSFTYGAFTAEVFRAGIQSIGKGQMEAARSQGMSYWQAMRYIILPQAIRNVLPALGNDFISMLKDTSLVSVLAVRDITQVARLYAGQTFRFPEAYTTLAAMYLTMTVLLSLLVKMLEKRYHQ
jgi:polar amino acid transport system permease protein